MFFIKPHLPKLRGGFHTYSAQTGGWDDKGKFGFKHTATLDLIKGDTLRNATRVLPAFQDNYSYKDSSQIDSLVKPFRFQLRPGVTCAKLRTILTGHDQEGEFSPIQFYVKLNGRPIYQKRLWKTNCDQNPIQPQSGTWIFSRTNWCSGEKVNEIEVPLPTLLVDKENEVKLYCGKIGTESKEIHAIYSIESHVITYKYQDSIDLALVEIIYPSRNPHYRMHNPPCSRIKLWLKNEGIMTSDSVFMFGENGMGHKFNYKNKLLLEPSQSAMVEVEMGDAHGGSADISLYEGRRNQNRHNDQLQSSGNIPPKHKTKQLVFEITTTNDSSVNILNLIHGQGDTQFKKDCFHNTFTFRDTANIASGC